MRIYHLVTPTAWAAATRAGSYSPASLQSEGFIHFSFIEQLIESANRHFRDVPELLAVAYDSDQLGERLVVEDTSGHGEFPHCYASLDPTDAVAQIELLHSEGWQLPTP